jgi:hypothetical protein
MDSQNIWQEADEPHPVASAGGLCHLSETYASGDALKSIGIPNPSARDESTLFDLIGKIDHKILQGDCVYIQVRGIAYKILYGVYWRSVCSGAQFWGFRCEEIERGMWAEGSVATTQVDIPICFTQDGWVVEEQSLKFILFKDTFLFEYTLT